MRAKKIYREELKWIRRIMQGQDKLACIVVFRGKSGGITDILHCFLQNIKKKLIEE